MNHSFDIDHARLYGIPEAIIISNLQYWIGRNKANGENLLDGRTWTYNSVKSFAELFPYLSAGQVRRALDHLVELGVLVDGNYNISTYDRTKWYAFFDESIFLRHQFHLSNSANGIGNGDKTVNTNITPYKKPDRNPNTPAKAGDGYPKAFEDAWSAYPKRSGANKKSAFAQWSARIKAGADPEEIMRGVLAYAKYVREKRTEDQYIKQAETFFGPKEHYRSDWIVRSGAGGETDEERTARIIEEFCSEVEGSCKIVDME